MSIMSLNNKVTIINNFSIFNILTSLKLGESSILYYLFLIGIYFL